MTYHACSLMFALMIIHTWSWHVDSKILKWQLLVTSFRKKRSLFSNLTYQPKFSQAQRNTFKLKDLTNTNLEQTELEQNHSRLDKTLKKASLIISIVKMFRLPLTALCTFFVFQWRSSHECNNWSAFCFFFWGCDLHFYCAYYIAQYPPNERSQWGSHYSIRR